MKEENAVVSLYWPLVQYGGFRELKLYTFLAESARPSCVKGSRVIKAAYAYRITALRSKGGWMESKREKIAEGTRQGSSCAGLQLAYCLSRSSSSSVIPRTPEIDLTNMTYRRPHLMSAKLGGSVLGGQFENRASNEGRRSVLPCSVTWTLKSPECSWVISSYSTVANGAILAKEFLNLSLACQKLNYVLIALSIRAAFYIQHT
ncbi:hypothetical protein VOLCADRAFT_91023 [Volvox carteri f. nagariensis]|uniref:Uncharacterized protein n=1 Tax=Volvox carteri f. nagariensis TaxID=3068 RepID=D8TVZ4_VOLCA|nr:uncharacterized protein VOLCADRAFT_91023 [Volvox carteri f. nagariensis]EFJ48389.1 hypothetical protein VOLCADRAFT_91023 [Volvox carteri f. nagariensis]|eukprot:XP_002950643.1 hypothetical protein VOLCADRAFT_91023 [Volvox carteri f. nagariensis]